MGCVQVILPARCQTNSSCGFFPQGHKNSTLHMWFYFKRKENTLICMCYSTDGTEENHTLIYQN
jgi:hypothetical protein